MSDVGEKMLFELRRIREALEGSQPLGFGKKVGPTYVFVRHHEVGGETYFWYSRDKKEGQNVPTHERDLTGYLVSVWRFDQYFRGRPNVEALSIRIIPGNSVCHLALESDDLDFIHSPVPPQNLERLHGNDQQVVSQTTALGYTV